MITKMARQFYNESQNFGEGNLSDGTYVWTNGHVNLTGEPPIGLRDLYTTKGIKKLIESKKISYHCDNWFALYNISEDCLLSRIGLCGKVQPARNVTPVMFHRSDGEKVILNKVYVDFIFKTWPKAKLYAPQGALSFINILSEDQVVGVFMPLNITLYYKEELEVTSV